MGAYGMTPATAFKVVDAEVAVTYASASTFNGTEIDTRDFDGGWAVFVVSAGNFTGAGCTAAIKIQETDVTGFGGTVADVSGAAFANITASNDNTVYIGAVRLQGRQRFLRCHTTTSGTVTTAPLAVVCLLYGAGSSASQSVAHSFTV